ncbi:MAG: ABC transporter permease subunit [Trueperaceae bacterium]|nr:ABC transporter permease subunit [Trueperaceae bacterium]
MNAGIRSLAAALAALPFAALVIASLAFRWTWPDLLPSTWWWEARGEARLPIGWDYVASPAARAWVGLATTATIAGAVTVVGLAIAWPAARVLAHERFRGKAVVETLLLAPLLVPELAIALGLATVAVQVGVAGSWWGVLLAHVVPVLPYLVRTLAAVEVGFDRDLADAARVHGASAWDVLRYLRLPLLAPGVAASALFAFLVSAHVVVVTVLVGQGRVETTATQLFARLGGGGALDPITAAFALLMTLPGLVALVILQRVLRSQTDVAAVSRLARDPGAGADRTRTLTP